MIVLRTDLLQFNDQSDQHFLLWHLSTFLLVPLPGKEKGFGWFLACCSPMAGIAIARTLTREKVVVTNHGPLQAILQPYNIQLVVLSTRSVLVYSTNSIFTVRH